MKYLKISSLLVLSLLLFAPSALAEIKCEVKRENERILVESMSAMLESLELECSWAATDFAADDSATDQGITEIELTFSEDLANKDNNPPMLKMKDPTATATTTQTAVDAIDDVEVTATEAGGDTVRWEDVQFPGDWDVTAISGNTTTSIWITNVMVDATGADEGDEVTVDYQLEFDNADSSADIDADGSVRVARIDQGIDAELEKDAKVTDINSCNPAKFKVKVMLTEGWSSAWDGTTDISFMIPDGKITGPATVGTLLERETSRDANVLIYSVTAKDGESSEPIIELEITPTAGGDVGDNLDVSVMFLPTTVRGPAFKTSAEVTVGTYTPCKGESLFFPYVTSDSGWFTGIAVINDSKVDGSCSLNWGNMDLDEDEMEALSRIDVDSKDFTVVHVSEANADYSGSLGMQCTFKEAHGFVFLSEGVQHIGQSYVVEGK